LSHGVFRLWCFCFPEGYAFFYLLRCTPELVITPKPIRFQTLIVL
jgi:hypothetical protein